MAFAHAQRSFPVQGEGQTGGDERDDLRLPPGVCAAGFGQGVFQGGNLQVSRLLDESNDHLSQTVVAVGERHEFRNKPGVGAVYAYLPDFMKSVFGGHGIPESGEIADGQSLEGFEYQIIHGAEVVIHQTLLDSEIFRDPAGGQGGVSLLAQDFHCGVEHRFRLRGGH